MKPLACRSSMGDSPEKDQSKKSAEKGHVIDTFPPEVVSGLPQAEKLKTTLYDLAQHSLTRRAEKTGEHKGQDQIYFELNRIMRINGYTDAKLDGRSKISDENLPKGWNAVKSGQEFKLYDSADLKVSPAEALSESIRRQIIEETLTIPVKPKQGYYQVLEDMNPAQAEPERVKEARRIKAINGGREVLIVGERLPTATEKQRAEMLEKRLREAAEKEKAKAPPERETKPEPKPETKPESKADPGKKSPATPETKPPEEKGNPAGDGSKNNQPPVKDPAVEKAEAAKAAMQAEVARLAGEHAFSQKALKQELSKQGFIGNAFDAAKNNIGTSGQDKSWYEPGRLWSGLFDKDLGSAKTNETLANEKNQLIEMKKAADAGDIANFSRLHKTVTGSDFDATKGPVANQGKDDQSHSIARLAAKNFNHSQETGVGTITDITAGLAAMGALRFGKEASWRGLAKASGAGFLIGGTTKASLMQADGAYGNFGRDFAIGGLLGATVPIGELAGAKLSTYAGKKLGLTVSGDFLAARIETQGTGIGTRLLSASLKSGTSGGVFGMIESPGREVIEKVDRGEKIDPLHLLSTSLKGATVGFLGGTFLGFTADGVVSGFRSLKPGEFKPGSGKIGQVAEGGVSLDEAGKALSLKPGDLAKKAVDNPYGAVQDAVKLYEKTGQNIKGNNLATGHTPLPEAFDDALKLSQKVDILTSESPVKLSKKVEIIKSVDDYLKTEGKTVDEAFTRVADSPEYQELIKLKQAQTGPQSADDFTSSMHSNFDEQVKTGSAVELIGDQRLTSKQAVEATLTKTEEKFKQKVSDYFKDMTDPAQKQRLNELVGEIDQKFNPELVTVQDLNKVLNGYQGKEREMALALLQESVATASDVQLRTRLQSLKGELESKLGTATPDVYTLQAGSSGNAIGYLYRKSISSSMSIRNLDQLEKGSLPNRLVLFDDLSSTPLTTAQKDLLKKIPEVYVVDVGAFEKAVNVLDLSAGVDGVSTKLAALMTEARQVSAANPVLMPSGVARQVLSESVDEAAKAIGGNVKVIRPPSSGKAILTSSSEIKPGMVEAGANAPLAAAVSSEVEAVHAGFNTPRASRDDIAQFLSGYVGEERELAGRMLAEGATHNSFPEMVRKASALKIELEGGLKANGMTMNDLVLVTDRDPGGSTHLISYLFGKVNGLSSENFISTSQLNKLITTGGAKSKAVAYFDDTIYSGSQTTGMLDNNISSLSPFKRIIVASLGAYEKGINSIKGTHLASLGKVDVKTAAMHEPFYSNKNPFFAKMSPSAQYSVKSIGGSEGFGSVQGSIIWSYMYPDNNLHFFGSKFSGGTLKLPGP